MSVGGGFRPVFGGGGSSGLTVKSWAASAQPNQLAAPLAAMKMKWQAAFHDDGGIVQAYAPGADTVFLAGAGLYLISSMVHVDSPWDVPVPTGRYAAVLYSPGLGLNEEEDHDIPQNNNLTAEFPIQLHRNGLGVFGDPVHVDFSWIPTPALGAPDMRVSGATLRILKLT